MYGRHRSFVRSALAALTALVALPASALSFLPWENVRITYDTYTHSDGITRSVGVMMPTNRAERAPAIVVLHFNLGGAPGMANLTEIGELAREFADLGQIGHARCATEVEVQHDDGRRRHLVAQPERGRGQRRRRLSRRHDR
jgi:hypothetical protein